MHTACLCAAWYSFLHKIAQICQREQCANVYAVMLHASHTQNVALFSLLFYSGSHRSATASHPHPQPSYLNQMEADTCIMKKIDAVNVIQPVQCTYTLHRHNVQLNISTRMSVTLYMPRIVHDAHIYYYYFSWAGSNFLFHSFGRRKPSFSLFPLAIKL